MESAKRKRKQQNQKEGQHGKAQRHGWTISIYIDPERDASVSRYLFFYSSLSLSLCVYVSLWRSVCFCARPAGHCSGTKRKLVKVKPVLVSVPSVLVVHENGRASSDVSNQLQKHQRSIERERERQSDRVCVVML